MSCAKDAGAFHSLCIPQLYAFSPTILLQRQDRPLHFAPFQYSKPRQNKRSKLVIGALALITVSAMAVESANTVGYTTTSVPQGTYYMLGLQYEKVGGGAIPVQDLVKGTFTGVNYDSASAFMQTAPKLQVWTPSGYNMYYYLNDAYDLDLDDGTTYEGWADGYGNFVTDNFPIGYGFWFNPTSAVTVGFTSPVPAN